MREVAWRDSMRPVRFFVFDARLLFLFAPWLFHPSWPTTAALLAAIAALRVAEARGYRLATAIRAVRARLAGRRPALYRVRRFADYG